MCEKLSLDGIKAISASAYAFLSQRDLTAIPNGRYDLNHNIYINIETYVTQPEWKRQYEAHRKYVDIQFLISGQEFVSICPIAELEGNKAYSPEQDIAYYQTGARSEGKGKRYLLGAGEGLVIYPHEGHMPCLNPSKNVCSQVKKAVVKIPYSYYKNIKFLVLDVDGTLTDGKIYMGSKGEICKAFNIKDGYGIKNILKPAGIETIIITARSSEILEQRCRELAIERLCQSAVRKEEQLQRIMTEISGELKNVAYVGDDANDIECMQLVKNAGGLVGCPSDAVTAVKDIANYICEKRGGDGAVREFIDWMVETEK